jgi:hypothetical protein
MLVEGHVSTPVAQSVKKCVPRQSATQLQEAAADALDLTGMLDEDAEAVANTVKLWRTRITKQWICKRRDCKRSGQRCYWAVRDEHEFHMPVGGQILTTWAKAIKQAEKDGDNSVNIMRPPHSAMQQLMADKRVLEQSTEKQSQRALRGMMPYHFYPPPPYPMMPLAP